MNNQKMGLTMSLQFIEGVLQIANVFLSIVAGIIAASLFKSSTRHKLLKPWRYLIAVLILFALVLIFGALRSFNIFESPFITHIIPTVMLALLIVALVQQINISTKTK
jgi:peptidoglycan/LPS O-acetylase OafA/YrhL